MISNVRCYIDPQHPYQAKARYSAEVLFDGMGVGHQFVDKAHEADILYTPHSPEQADTPQLWLPAVHQADWDLKSPKMHTDGDLPYLGAKSSAQSGFKGDLFYSCYALLTGCFETAESKDDFGVPVAGRHYMPDDLLQTPAIALYCKVLKQQLEQQLGKSLNTLPMWPEGKKFAIVMSHDVDAPCSVIGLKFRRKLVTRLHKKKQFAGAIKAMAMLVLKAFGSLGRENSRYRQDPNLCFDKWMALQNRLGTKSAFYIATTTSADDIGAPQDVHYDYTNPVFVEQVNKATKAGFEIGLHGSINAWRYSDGIAKEKAALEQVLPGINIIGNRHHYWSMDDLLPENTLVMHQKAGLFYDSSLGLNDAPGFRRGMVWPYYPIHPETDEVMSLIEVPPTLMDGGVFYHAVNETEGAERIRAHIYAVEKIEGCVVLNWHLEQMNPANLRQAGPVLSKVLMEYADRDEIFWASPSEMAKWWQQRRQQLDSVCG